MLSIFRTLSLVLIALVTALTGTAQAQSVAREWNEELLEAIRNDFARPTVHARNLYHTSIAMWDAWAAYDRRVQGVIVEEHYQSGDLKAAREEAISYAAFRLLSWRFRNSPGNDPENPDDPNNTLNRLEQQMVDLGYDPDFSDAAGDSPASLGLRIANAIIEFGLNDGANESADYANQYYEPVNPPLDLDEVGNPDIIDPNRWQPLTTDAGFVDQSGNTVGLAREFLGAEWGNVTAFALEESDATVITRDDNSQYRIFLDPGAPPQLGQGDDNRLLYIDTFKRVLEYSSLLTPTVTPETPEIDISPASIGNNTLGSNDGDGYNENPATGQPYTPQMVPSGDFFRVMAEYWADGPASETPPGHWFTIYNEISDHPDFERRLQGAGAAIDPLEWDVLAYLMLGGTVHDAAVTSWSLKGHYDYIRPVSAIRYMATMGYSCGASSPPDCDTNGVNHSLHGLPLEDGLIELITPSSSAPGEKHAHLADHLGEVAVYAWQGHVADPDNEFADVGWILAGSWWPYQQPDFVTPPFAGFVSGHSTFSRAAAELLTRLTGSEFFPGGLHEHCVPANTGLHFERGPSVALCLQWATYFDASDQSGISRIFGGIHPPADDIPGRLIGETVGQKAFARALEYRRGEVRPLFKDGFEAN